MPGFAISEDAVESSREDGDTASVRLTIDRSSGSEQLEQRVIRFAPGRSKEHVLDGRQEVVYVVSGRGTLIIEGREHELEPEMGAYIAAGERFEVDNPGPEELVVVAVSLAQENGASPPVREAHRTTFRPADAPRGRGAPFRVPRRRRGGQPRPHAVPRRHRSEPSSGARSRLRRGHLRRRRGGHSPSRRQDDTDLNRVVYPPAAPDCAYAREPRPRPHAGSRRLSPRRRPCRTCLRGNQMITFGVYKGTNH